MQAQWCEQAARSAAVASFLEDARSAASAHRQRAGLYPHLQARASAFTGSTIPAHQHTARALHNALALVPGCTAGGSARGGKERSAWDDNDEAPLPPTYSAVQALLNSLQQQRTAQRSALSSADGRIACKLAEVSVPLRSAPAGRHRRRLRAAKTDAPSYRSMCVRAMGDRPVPGSCAIAAWR